MDDRPLNCRFRLADEGRPHPRSSCDACGRTITSGLSKSCQVVSDKKCPNMTERVASYIRHREPQISKSDSMAAAVHAIGEIALWMQEMDEKDLAKILLSRRFN